VIFRLARVPLAVLMLTLASPLTAQQNPDLLGLPELPVPADNPITKEKAVLGERLFNDKRFSSTGKISCATCHDPKKGFTDNLRVSKGINGLTGTRNSPTVANAAFNQTQFWDGRSPSLEEQSQHPIVNPVEMGLANHDPVMKIVREDKQYIDGFKAAFNVEPAAIQLDHVLKAIATFERTVIDGNSRFDRWYYGGQNTLTPQEIRGFNVFVGNGRCVSCHAVEHTTALFTDHKFHNIGVGINRVPAKDIDAIATEFIKAQYDNATVDKKVLTDPKTSEIGRLAVTRKMFELGAFKTSTLRNIDLTAPYMHDGSLKTLEEVVEHYNRGGASSEKEKASITPFLSGGIRPLNLTANEKRELVAFMKSLTSAKYLAKKTR
jgi:cytochrome c peroxidase